MRYLEFQTRPNLTRNALINKYKYNYGFNPALEIQENEEELLINIELPGLKKEDVKLVYENSILKLSGEKKNKNTDTHLNSLILNERAYGKFERNIRLSNNFDSNSIDANFENGILSIKIKKIKSGKPGERIIEINQN